MTTDGTRVEWKQVHIRFKGDVDVDALSAAIEPPADVADGLPPIWRDRPDSLLRRFLSWGWTCDDNAGAYQRTGRPTLIGVYGDFTLLEEDERLMVAIAPFVAAGSSAIFEAADTYKLEGWDFNGTGVRRRDAEELVEYQWA